MKQMHVKSSLPKDLTPAEFSILQKDAIQSYNDALWLLADLLAIGKAKFGRTRLMSLTPLTLTKVQWLISAASVKHRNPKLLPDHHMEVAGIPNPDYWLKRAVAENLNPLQLRKAIRESQRGYKKVTPLKKVSDYPRLMDQVERELKKLPADERIRATVYVARRVQDLSK